ncbi:hypothetical protein KCU66_g5, partial [Aureobasidium melanogenum]
LFERQRRFKKADDELKAWEELERFYRVQKFVGKGRLHCGDIQIEVGEEENKTLSQRIVTVFVERYCDKTDPGDMMDKDTVYVLAYAIIIPNTNQHNPNMKPARMGMTDLAHNLRWRKRHFCSYIKAFYCNSQLLISGSDYTGQHISYRDNTQHCSQYRNKSKR